MTSCSIYGMVLYIHVVRHHVTRIKSEIAQEARKALGKLNFKLSIISYLGGGGR